VSEHKQTSLLLASGKSIYIWHQKTDCFSTHFCLSELITEGERKREAAVQRTNPSSASGVCICLTCTSNPKTKHTAVADAVWI
jgi:hypothetical protein